MTLLTDIEATRFSDDAAAVFTGLAPCDLSDEFGKVVLCAAAHILAAGACDDEGLFRLIDQFAELTEEIAAHRQHRRRHPRLIVVGGRDA